MTPKTLLRVAILLVAVPLASPVTAQDIEVQTRVSQTALWVGNVVTYTVTLVCRPDVDVLQEDLGADKLTLMGLQVVGHTLNRQATADGRTRYTVSYQVTTFEPGAEAVGIGDWTVRYVVGATGRGGSAPAQDLRIPGAALAWRSALPAALRTLDIRGGRTPQPAPGWWRATRAAGLILMATSVGASGWLLATWLGAGRPRQAKRRVSRESAHDLQTAFNALRDAPVSGAAERLAAYAALEAAVRRYAGEVTSLPTLALTPAEFRERLSVGVAPLPADLVCRILTGCQGARYQSANRLPDEQHFRDTLAAAAELVAGAR